MGAKWILFLSCIPVFATAGYAGLLYPRLDERLKAFCWFLFLSGAVQIVSLILWWKGIHNMPLHHIYVTAGFCCLTWFYGSVLRDFVPRRVIVSLMALFVVFSVLNIVYLQSIKTFDSHGATVEAVVVIIFALSTLLLSQHKVVSEYSPKATIDRFATVTKDEPFLPGLAWINAGLLIYFTSSVLLFYYGEIINHYFPKSISRYSSDLHAFFSVTLYTCSFIGLWKSRRK
jgi:hypothetical protein